MDYSQSHNLMRIQKNATGYVFWGNFLCVAFIASLFYSWPAYYHLVLGLNLNIGWLNFQRCTAIFAVLLCLSGSICYIYAKLYTRNLVFWLDGTGVHWQEGIFRITTNEIPYHRVQSATFRETWFGDLFGVVWVSILDLAVPSTFYRGIRQNDNGLIIRGMQREAAEDFCARIQVHTDASA